MRNLMYFKETSSAALGVIITSLPAIPIAEEKGEWVDVPGRDGALFLADGAFEDVSIPVQIWVKPDASISAVTSWLSGSGNLRFNAWPWFWKARVNAEVAMLPCSFNDGWTAAVQFTAKPHRYHYPEAEEQTFAASGTITNPGTAASLPRIAITGSGDFTVSVAGTYMEFFGVTGGVAVDSEKMDVFAQDGLTLANSCASVTEFPKLQPGPNAVSWTGSITKMEILPRWRDV